MTCSQVYAKGDKKPYRFYPNPKFNARFFGNDTQFSSRNFSEEIEGIKKQINDIQNSVQQVFLKLINSFYESPLRIKVIYKKSN